jgi:hypothetical protein
MYPIVNPEAADFAAELESCGVRITRREEVIERLQESWNWRRALATLVRHGGRISIAFNAPANAVSTVCRLLERKGFEPRTARDCAQRICTG